MTLPGEAPAPAQPAVPTSPRVGIVILNWKRPDDTRACLRSLQRVSAPSHHVIVVDNGAVEGSPGELRREFPWVTVVENGRNLGFAGGCNVGIRHALGLGVDYVLLLNDDTEVDPAFLSALVEQAEAAPDVGIVGPKICYFGQPEIVWFAGGRIDRNGEPSHVGADRPDDPGERGLVDVDYVTGCALLIKRQAVEAVGVLDERFFAYFEETEWCSRARAAGYRVGYVPHARVWHKIEMTARTTSPLYLYLMARNRLLYLRCRGAGPLVLARAISDMLRGAAVSTWRAPRGRGESSLPYVAAGIADYLRGRFGAPRELSTGGTA